MELTYNYVFHYNFHEDLWWAIPRDNQNNYWNGGDKRECLFDSSIDNLITKIIKDESINI